MHWASLAVTHSTRMWWNCWTSFLSGIIHIQWRPIWFCRCITYSQSWLLNIVVADRLLMCLDNGERVYRSYRQERLVEKLKKMSMTYRSGSCLDSATSLRWHQQQFRRRRITFRLRNWQRHRRSCIFLKSGVWTSSRYLLTMCFQHLPCSIVTFLPMPTSQHL